MLRTSSFLNRTVNTPEIAFTTVDFPCATCPIVPKFIVAYSYEIVAQVRFMHMDVMI
jgi:hypothetical protein